MTPLLVARGLAKSFGAREAVSDLSLELRPGETFALVGPNGAGKTTTLRMLAGLIAPNRGQVELNGRELTPQSAASARRQVGFLTEAPGLWDRLTVRQNLTVYARLYGLPAPAAAVDAALARFGVLDRAREPAAQLSKGLRQRVALARTLLHDPAIVLLDEPTSGLDPESARSVRELVRGLETEGRAVLICTHNLDEVERLAARVAVLRTRLLVVDTPQGAARALFRQPRAGAAGSRDGTLRRAAACGRCERRQGRGRCAVGGARRQPGALHRGPGAAAGGSRRAGRGGGARDPVARRGLFACARGWPGMNGRVRALLAKEIADLRLNPGVFGPAVLTAAISLLLPFFVAVIVPYATGERLSDSSDLRVAAELFRTQPWTRALDPEGAVQAFIFQQFLILLVLSPVAASMSSAAFSIIGEKQARTLEPLLATPISTPELLGAKILGAFVPAACLTVAIFAIYIAGAALLASPGVYRALLTPASLAVVFLVGPLASLLALQMAVCVSSRVNDARSAQQIGALVILPIAGLLIAQVVGSIVLTRMAGARHRRRAGGAERHRAADRRRLVRSRVDSDAVEMVLGPWCYLGPWSVLGS